MCWNVSLRSGYPLQSEPLLIGHPHRECCSWVFMNKPPDTEASISLVLTGTVPTDAGLLSFLHACVRTWSVNMPT